MKRSNALKNMPISPIEQTIDEAMRHLPVEIDLSRPEDRMKLRAWMVRICSVVVIDSAHDFSKAAAGAIEEAAALAINPNYYEERKRRREKYKAMRAAKQVSERPQTRAEIAFHRMVETTVKM